MKQKFSGLIPSQHTGLGGGLVPRQGTYERKPINTSLSHTDGSLPLFLFPSPSLLKKYVQSLKTKIKTNKNTLK